MTKARNKQEAVIVANLIQKHFIKLSTQAKLTSADVEKIKELLNMDPDVATLEKPMLNNGSASTLLLLIANKINNFGEAGVEAFELLLSFQVSPDIQGFLNETKTHTTARNFVEQLAKQNPRNLNYYQLKDAIDEFCGQSER